MSIIKEEDLGTRLHICKNCLVPILKHKPSQSWLHIYHAPRKHDSQHNPFNFEVYYVRPCVSILVDGEIVYAEPIRS